MHTGVVLIISALGAGTAILPAASAESFRDCSDCPLMVTVPAGSFMMGSTEEETAREYPNSDPDPYLMRGQSERPRHFVSVNTFSLSVTEVTRDQFDGFVRATGYQSDGCFYMLSTRGRIEGSPTPAKDWRDPGFSQGGNHPVVCVSWDDAKAYVSWLSAKTGKDYRLPSEAEWEYAARAGTNTARYWGDSRSEPACLNANASDRTHAAARDLDTSERKTFQCTDGYAYTAPTGLFRANAFGLHDMMGNAWEWTEDCFNPSYKDAPADGSARLTGMCTLRIKRGGAWDSGPWGVRSAFNSAGRPDYRRNVDGFRVARSN